MAKEPQKIKVAPNSKESEMMVLGSMLSNVNALNVAADALDGSDFYYTEHSLIFETLKEAYKKDKPADIHLVAEELKRKKKLKEIGGISYLTTLAQYAGTSAYVEEYAQLVKNKAILRRMITAAQIIEKKALEEEDEVSKTLDEAQSLFFKISQTANRESGLLIAELLSGVKAESQLPYLKELQDRQEKFQELGEGEELFPGHPTHFNDLDHILGGLGNSHFLILAARPAMGKTILALNIAENICFKNKVPVAIFSLEMSAEQLLHRMISSQSEVEAEKIKRGSLSGSEYQRVVSAVNEMQKHTIIIDDQPGLKITDLRARARRMKETHNIGLIIIDYLQLLSGSGNRSSQESRQLEISEISRMLKNLARELDIPILCLSQLSRKVEERAGHRPMMSDLRESGCLTGDTEIIDAKTGEIHTIKELAERKKQIPIQVHAVDSNFKVGKFPLVKAFYSGEKQVFEIKMRSGKKIKASSNHPFLTKESWQPVEKLKTGTIIAISNSSSTEIIWDAIDSITPLGVEPVYDATVEKAHNFLANGIFAHNSLEQDSDVVMFLMRPEYYDPYNKPGLAEIIVGKNRHGKTGDVKLTFRKEIVQFANYTDPSTSPSGEESQAFDAFSPN